MLAGLGEVVKSFKVMFSTVGVTLSGLFAMFAGLAVDDVVCKCGFMGNVLYSTIYGEWVFFGKA